MRESDLRVIERLWPVFFFSSCINCSLARRSSGGIRNDSDCSRAQRFNLLQHFFHQWQRFRQPCASGSQDYNRHTRRWKVLLELQISIACDENVEPLLPHLVQQLTILNSAPAHPLYRRAKMPA
jgi:hypothetical protein